MQALETPNSLYKTLTFSSTLFLAFSLLILQMSYLTKKFNTLSHLLRISLSNLPSPQPETMESVNRHADPDVVTETIAAAMQHDLVARYFQLDAYDLPNSTEISLEQSIRFFHDLLDSLYEAGAIFAQTREPGGVAVWYEFHQGMIVREKADFPFLNRCPPNFEWPVEAGPYLSNSLEDYSVVAETSKQRRMGRSPYWYLFVIGRDPSHLGASVAPRLILPFVQKAKEQGIPLWLEATSERSKSVYEKLGFKVVEELKVGKGQCDSNGNLISGGEGVSMWAMICDHI
jgi:hypothetical protein